MHRNRTRPVASRVRAIAISCLLLSITLLGCSTGWNPLDPLDPPGGQDPPSVQDPPPGQDPPGGPPADAVVPRGILEVSVTGSQVVFAAGYRLIIQVDGELEPLTTIARLWPPLRWPLSPGTYTVRVEPLLDHCAEEQGSARPFSIVATETTRIEFRVSCDPVFGFAAGTYERRPDAGSIPGYLSERYELQADGSFRLVYQTSADHSFHYTGEFYVAGQSPVGQHLRFLFSPRDNATATLQGDCLVVEYGTNMALSEFADGTFCRS